MLKMLSFCVKHKDVTPERTLELASCHAIVSCVAAGTGVAVVPRSMLDTFRGIAQIAAYNLSAASAKVTTPLVWRKGESSLALDAQRGLVAQGAKRRGRG